MNLGCVVWFLYNIDLQDMVRKCLFTSWFTSLCDSHYVGSIDQCESIMYIEQISDLSEGYILNLEHTLI